MSDAVVRLSKMSVSTIARRYPDSMKPKSGVYSLISRLTSEPAATPIPPSEARTKCQVAQSSVPGA